MGQGYKAIILASQTNANDSEIIRTWVDSHTYGNGYKLMEHSYIGNNYVEALEYLISPLGMFYKSRVVWAGDYADNETGHPDNLYIQASNMPTTMSTPPRQDMSAYRYVVNHTKKLYIDKNIEDADFTIHPLPLLTAEGNGRGGGDFHGNNEELVGTWARDTLSVEMVFPAAYQELICDFSE